MKRKISAIMCADVVGYSRLVAEDEEEALRRLMSYRKVFQTFIEDAGGRIFNTAGDAILAEFPSAVDAVRAAIDIQESLRTRNTAYPKSRQMPFRIGITIGDVVEQDGDLLGDAVNIAARLQTLSQPGGICLSRAVREQVANKLSAHFRDLGPQSVKNIPQEIHAFTIEFGQLAEDAVPPARPQRPAGRGYGLAAVAILLAVAAGAAVYWLGAEREVVAVEEPVPAPVAAVEPAVPAEPAPAASPATAPPSVEPQSAPAQAVVPAAPATIPAPAAEEPAQEETVAEAPVEESPAGGSPAAEAPDGPKAVLPPARPQAPYSSEPMKGRRFAASLVPFICGSCRTKMAGQYAKGGSHKAVAINSLGDVGWAWDWNTEAGAREAAIAQCKGRNGKDCEVFAVDSTIVWEHPAPVVPNRPWVGTDDEGAPFDAAAIAGLSDTARQTISEKYAPAPGPKALAVGPGGEWSYFTKGDSGEDVMRQALEVCSHFAKAVCTIAAVDDRLVNNGGARSTAGADQ